MNGHYVLDSHVLESMCYRKILSLCMRGSDVIRPSMKDTSIFSTLLPDNLLNYWRLQSLNTPIYYVSRTRLQ